MINLMFEAQAEAAFEEAKLLLKNRVFRIDVVTKPGEFSLDKATPDKIAHLINLGRGEGVKREVLEAVTADLSGSPKHRNLFHFIRATSRIEAVGAYPRGRRRLPASTVIGSIRMSLACRTTQRGTRRAVAAVEKTKERLWEAEIHRIAGENHAQVTRTTGSGESSSVFREGTRGCAPAASKVPGTSRRNEPRAALA
jgi:hypothetical protein